MIIIVEVEIVAFDQIDKVESAFFELFDILLTINLVQLKTCPNAFFCDEIISTVEGNFNFIHNWIWIWFMRNLTIISDSWSHVLEDRIIACLCMV